MIEYGCPALRLGSLIHRRGERPPIRQDIESLIGSAAAATSDIGTELALFPTWERESRKHYRQTQKGWPGERQFRKSLLGYLANSPRSMSVSPSLRSKDIKVTRWTC